MYKKAQVGGNLISVLIGLLVFLIVLVAVTIPIIVQVIANMTAVPVNGTALLDPTTTLVIGLIPTLLAVLGISAIALVLTRNT